MTPTSILADVLTSGIMILPVIGIVIVIFLFFAVWSSRYTKVGPDQVLIISGRQYVQADPAGTLHQRGFRIVKGGGTFVLPVVEKVDVLSLEISTIEFQFPKVVTSTGDRLVVDGVAQVKINSDDGSIVKAAEHFLNKAPDAIRLTATQTLESHCRSALGSCSSDQIFRNGSVLTAKIQEQASRDLATMGLSLVSFTIRDFRDGEGTLAASSKPPISATT